MMTSLSRDLALVKQNKRIDQILNTVLVGDRSWS